VFSCPTTCSGIGYACIAACCLLLGCGRFSSPVELSPVSAVRRPLPAERLHCQRGRRFADRRLVLAPATLSGGVDRVQLFESLVRFRLALGGVSDCDPLIAIDGTLLRGHVVTSAAGRSTLAFRAVVVVSDARSGRVIASLPLAKHQLLEASHSRSALDHAWAAALDDATRSLSRVAYEVRAWRLAALQKRVARRATRAVGEKTSARVASPEPPRPLASNVTRGSCAVVHPNGSVLTAYHVVTAAKSVTVTLADGRTLPADVMRVDPRHDLALLRVSARRLPYLPLASRRQARLGARVFTIGFPAVGVLGRQPRFTEGSISALCGPLGTRELLQISVPLQPGNSGGRSSTAPASCRDWSLQSPLRSAFEKPPGRYPSRSILR
jgi:hypothetical protein